jgi:hypothetical protein
MFRSTLVVLGGALAVLLASCSDAPSSPGATDDPSDKSPAAVAPAVTASSASCSVSSSPEFTVTVSWSKLPVQRVVLWHSLGDRFSTVSLNHQSQKGTASVQLGFEPVLAVFFDRAGTEVARRTC